MDEETKEKVALTVGKKTNEDMAKWFEIGISTFSRNKEKRLKELESYADFHMTKGNKIIIDNVKDSYYEKYSSKIVTESLPYFDETWGENGHNTCSNVGSHIKKCEGKSKRAKTRYATMDRDILYGKPDDEKGGKLGKCIRKLCKYDEVNRACLPLTEEDKETIEKIRLAYYKPHDNIDEYVRQKIHNGEIEEEQGWKIYEKMTILKNKFKNYEPDEVYKMYLDEVREALGYSLILGTYVERKFLEELDERDLKYAHLPYYKHMAAAKLGLSF